MAGESNANTRRKNKSARTGKKRAAKKAKSTRRSVATAKVAARTTNAKSAVPVEANGASHENARPVDLPAKRYHRTQEDAASALRITRQAFKKWLDAGCVCWTAPGYDLYAALWWRYGRDEKPESEHKQRLDEAKLLTAEAEAKLKMAKAEKLLGSLISRIEVKQQNVARAKVLARHLDKLVADLPAVIVEKLAQDIPPDAAGQAIDDVRELLERRINEARTAYVRGEP